METTSARANAVMNRLHVMLLLLVAVECHAAMSAVGNVVPLSDVHLQLGRVLEDLAAVIAHESIDGLSCHWVEFGDVTDKSRGGRVDGGALRALKRLDVVIGLHFRFVSDDQMALVHGQSLKSEGNLAKLAENVEGLLIMRLVMMMMVMMMM